MNSLRRMYRVGLGVYQDYNQAVYWYRLSAKAGEVYGLENLGNLYETGLGVERNLQQAIDLYRKAARLGNYNAKQDFRRLGINPE